MLMNRLGENERLPKSWRDDSRSSCLQLCQPNLRRTMSVCVRTSTSSCSTCGSCPTRRKLPIWPLEAPLLGFRIAMSPALWTPSHPRCASPSSCLQQETALAWSPVTAHAGGLAWECAHDNYNNSCWSQGNRSSPIFTCLVRICWLITWQAKTELHIAFWPVIWAE